MKKTSLLILFFPFLISSSLVFAYSSPGKPTGFVNDFAQVLSSAEVQSIDAKLSALKQQTGVEVAVVTVATVGRDETIESYATKLFSEWGIGDEKKDMGLLLLVAVTDRQVRIETGYGIEGAVTDIQSGNIIRNVITPAFKEGNYGVGISGAVNALTLIISDSPEAAQYSAAPPRDTGEWDFDLAGAFFFVVIIINLLSRFLGKTKSWWLGGVIGAVIGGVIALIFGFLYAGAISIGILTILGLIFDFIVSKHPPHKGGGIWPMFLGGGRGGSGGGFGGFGGGMSGGGGASGRW